MPLTIVGSRFYMSQSPRDFYIGLCFDRPSQDGVPHGEPGAGDYARELTHFIYSDASAELSNSEAVRFHALSDWGVMSYVVVSQVPSGEVFGYQVIPPQVMAAGTVLEVDVGDLIIGSGAYVATTASVTPGEHFHVWSEITGKPTVFPPQAEMLSLNQLVDVATTGVTDGQVLGFNAGVWGPITGGGGGDHPDADHTTFHPLGGLPTLDVSVNDVRLWDSTQTLPWKLRPLNSGDLYFEWGNTTAGVEPSTWNQGMHLEQAGSGGYLDVNGGMEATTGSFSTSLSVGGVVVSLAGHTHLWADITDKPTTFTPSTHTHLWADITDKPTTFAPIAQNLNWLTDVNTAGQAEGNTLVRVGGQWVPQAPTAQALDWLTDVATAGQTSGHVLTFNGTSWIPQSPPLGGIVAWADITGKPTTFPPDEHDTDHDDRFVTNFTSYHTQVNHDFLPLMNGASASSGSFSGTETVKITTSLTIPSSWATGWRATAVVTGRAGFTTATTFTHRLRIAGTAGLTHSGQTNTVIAVNQFASGLTVTGTQAIDYLVLGNGTGTLVDLNLAVIAQKQ